MDGERAEIIFESLGEIEIGKRVTKDFFFFIQVVPSSGEVFGNDLLGRQVCGLDRVRTDPPKAIDGLMKTER